MRLLAREIVDHLLAHALAARLLVVRPFPVCQLPGALPVQSRYAVLPASLEVQVASSQIK